MAWSSLPLLFSAAAAVVGASLVLVAVMVKYGWHQFGVSRGHQDRPDISLRGGSCRRTSGSRHQSSATGRRTPPGSPHSSACRPPSAVIDGIGRNWKLEQVVLGGILIDQRVRDSGGMIIRSENLRLDAVAVVIPSDNEVAAGQACDYGGAVDCPPSCGADERNSLPTLSPALSNTSALISTPTPTTPEQLKSARAMTKPPPFRAVMTADP